MRLNLQQQQGNITIDDNSPEAQKILQGYSWSFDGEKIVIGSKTDYDIKAFQDKLTLGTQTPIDIANFLKQLVQFYKDIKYK